MQQKKIINLKFDDTISIGVEIIPIDQNYVNESSNLTFLHRADFFCIIHFIEGFPTHTIDFIPIKAQPETYLFIGKNRLQFFDQENEFKAQVLLFTDSFFSTNTESNNFLRRTPLFNTFDNSQHHLLKSSEKLLACWHLIQQEEKEVTDRNKAFILRNLLFNFLLLAERQAGIYSYDEESVNHQHETYRRFQELVETHYKNQEPIAFYTGKLAISAKVLSRITEKLSGKSPKQILTDRLLLEAKRLLIHDTEAGKRIGYELGFSDPANFAKFFRKHTGQTPAIFRKSHSPARQ